jgi:hypothetical protein
MAMLFDIIAQSRIVRARDTSAAQIEHRNGFSTASRSCPANSLIPSHNTSAAVCAINFPVD